jgi:hypothetical protein
VALIEPLPGATSTGAQASAMHVGSTELHTLVGKQIDAFV